MSEDIRKYIGYMKNKKPIVNENIKTPKKEISVRELLGRMRMLNENLATTIDQNKEIEKMNNYFSNYNVNITYEDLIIKKNGVIFGGTIDDQLEFVFTVTPEEKSSSVEVNYLEGFDPQDPENDEVVNKLESYYDVFYKYWRSNILQ